MAACFALGLPVHFISSTIHFIFHFIAFWTQTRCMSSELYWHCCHETSTNHISAYSQQVDNRPVMQAIRCGRHTQLTIFLFCSLCILSLISVPSALWRALRKKMTKVSWVLKKPIAVSYWFCSCLSIHFYSHFLQSGSTYLKMLVSSNFNSWNYMESL